MRIAFLWPADFEVLITVPMAFGVLYERIRHLGHDVRMFNFPLEGWTRTDPRFVNAITEFDPDLICVSAWPTTAESAFDGLRQIRPLLERATCILGGVYASLSPEAAYDTGLFDYLLTGECEHTFPEFVRQLDAGGHDAIARIPGIYFRDADGAVITHKNVWEKNLDEAGEIDWDFIELNRSFARGYMKTALGADRKGPLMVSRGCPYSCQFCTVPMMNGTRMRYWSPEYVTRQIRRLYDDHGVRHINFMDDNMTQAPPQFKRVLQAIIEMGLPDLVLENYRGVRIESLDQEMLVLMRKAGFRHLIVAPETGSDRVRKLMSKGMSTADILRKTQMIKDAGLGVHAFFIVGFPGETRGERRETYRFIDKLGLDAFKIHKFLALPGTAAFNSLVQNGQLTMDYRPAGLLLGDDVPNYNDESSADLDREILLVYLWFYVRAPWKFVHVLRMSPLGEVLRALRGIVEGAMSAYRSKLLPSPDTSPALAAVGKEAGELLKAPSACPGVGMKKRPT